MRGNKIKTEKEVEKEWEKIHMRQMGNVVEVTVVHVNTGNWCLTHQQLKSYTISMCLEVSIIINYIVHLVNVK